MEKGRKLRPGKWKHWCRVGWVYLLDKVHDHPASAEAQWMNELIDYFGEDIQKWPKIGCESK